VPIFCGGEFLNVCSGEFDIQTLENMLTKMWCKKHYRIWKIYHDWHDKLDDTRDDTYWKPKMEKKFTFDGFPTVFQYKSAGFSDKLISWPRTQRDTFYYETFKSANVHYKNLCTPDGIWQPIWNGILPHPDGGWYPVQ